MLLFGFCSLCVLNSIKSPHSHYLIQSKAPTSIYSSHKKIVHHICSCRIFVNCRSSADSLQYAAPAFSTGSICITALRWLVDLRNKLAKEGLASFRSRVSLSLQRSKPQHQSQTLSRSGTGPLPDVNPAPPSGKSNTSAISAHEALSALLIGASSPFIVQLVEGALVIEAVSADVIRWLRTTESADLLSLAQVCFPAKSFDSNTL